MQDIIIEIKSKKVTELAPRQPTNEGLHNLTNDLDNLILRYLQVQNDNHWN